jgi:hypothetical protein
LVWKLKYFAYEPFSKSLQGKRIGISGETQAFLQEHFAVLPGGRLFLSYYRNGAGRAVY